MSSPVRGQRSLPIKLKNLITEKGFSTLKTFSFGTAMGLGESCTIHPFGDIWALLVSLKSTVSSFVKYNEGHFCITANLGKFFLI